MRQDKKKVVNPNLLFVGCGFLGHYYTGVTACFLKYAPHLLRTKISGASAGAIIGCWILCEASTECIVRYSLRVSEEARKTWLGPLHPNFKARELIYEALEKFLPEDAHLRVNGKLRVSFTRACDGKNVMISHFDSREDLIEGLCAASFVPFVSGFVPSQYKGTRYIDGVFSNNLPILDENTITISPFHGKCNICPRDDSLLIPPSTAKIGLLRRTIYRIHRVFFPSTPELLLKLARQGFDDSIRFLNENGLLRCAKCLEAIDERYEYNPECKECIKLRQEALVSSLPEEVVTLYQEAIESEINASTKCASNENGNKLSTVLRLSYPLLAVAFIYFIFVNYWKS